MGGGAKLAANAFHAHFCPKKQKPSGALTQEGILNQEDTISK
jgi:hypothetical protein